jgi:hypothetical protein
MREMLQYLSHIFYIMKHHDMKRLVGSVEAVEELLTGPYLLDYIHHHSRKETT